MSGGRLTDHTYDLYRLEDWAKVVEKENVLLAEMMCDLCKLLDRYDYYMSGDIGEDGVKTAWTTFRDKWLHIDSDTFVEILFDKCLEMVNGAVQGVRSDGN